MCFSMVMVTILTTFIGHLSLLCRTNVCLACLFQEYFSPRAVGH